MRASKWFVGAGMLAMAAFVWSTAAPLAAQSNAQGESGEPTFVARSLKGSKPKLICSAAVAADGTLDAGTGVASVSRLTDGRYEVICKKKVTANKCVNVAAIGEANDSVAPAGVALTNHRFGNAKGVFIRTVDLAGTSTDLPFTLHVTC